MPVSAAEIIAKFAPNAKAAYLKAFEQGGALLQAAGISTPMRLAHFMAQCLHETGGLTILVESGMYTRKSLAKMWDDGNWHKYFANREACLAMAEQCAIDKGQALFSLVYGNRMGNGPAESGDGWRYRGRGILQTTGRESYRKFGRKAGVDFEGDPDLIVSAEHALKPALAEWLQKNCYEAADNNDIEVVTRAINGGTVGLLERKTWFARIYPFVVGSVPLEQTTAYRVQAALRARNYKDVVADGIVGPISRSAILDFRIKHGLPATTSIGPDLLLALGID